jgi:RIO kinase 1
VHGDLSAYNILYWDGAITLIDFPQVTSLHANRNAYPILERDVVRVCEYFARQGARADGLGLARAMWTRYAALTERQRAEMDEMHLFGREFDAWLGDA